MYITVEVVVNIYLPLILNYLLIHGKFHMYFTSFTLFSTFSVIGHCRQCKELDNKARAREDYTLYRAMLKTIRKTEENYQDNSHIIFLIQVTNTLYYERSL